MPNAPLPLASLDGPFPAMPLLVEKYQRVHRFAASVSRFKRNRGFYTEALPFPATVKEERACGSSSCCRGLDEFFPGSFGKLKAAVVHIIDYIRVVLQHASNRKVNDSAGVHKKKDAVDDPTILLEFSSLDLKNKATLHYLVPTMRKLTEKYYQAEFFEMIPAHGVGAPLPQLFRFAHGPFLCGTAITQPLILTELELADKLHLLSEKWEIRVLTSTVIGLGEHLATDSYVFSCEDYKAACERAKQAQTALNAVDISLGTKNKTQRQRERQR